MNANPDFPKRILIAGASSDIGCSFLKLLPMSTSNIGAHYFQNKQALLDAQKETKFEMDQFQFLQTDLRHQKDCHSLVDQYVEWAGGIDAFVQLNGDIHTPCDWQELQEEDWWGDMNINLSAPFFLCQRVMKCMKKQGGRIILMSTASARHGGGPNSFGYGIAKAGIECLAKGLARIGAADNILVNAIAPGFIQTKFHTQRMKRSQTSLKKRAELVLLKRAGQPSDVASMIFYLLSTGGNYITGECFTISGGDWL
jgi:NAD(P)-dependent dehydrogenase (short-subunit alcohol dehydrogenase family)